MKRTIVIGLLGTQLDSRHPQDRWSKWRPSVGLCQQEDLLVARFDLLHEPQFKALAESVSSDMQTASPETEVRLIEVDFNKDPWDFESVYSALHDYAKKQSFDPDSEDYLIHITTGSHVGQICLFLLTESGHLPGRLIQTFPPRRNNDGPEGNYGIIDLDLSKYDRLAARFEEEQRETAAFLKSGIETSNDTFNRMIDDIEQVALHSRAPVLLMGPTGAGKSQLARRIYELKKSRGQLSGNFVEVNCATLRGDSAMSALFGHVKGSFTGATTDRPGLLKAAHNGLLFLDEIGELGADEQAMLLRALEEKRFLPLGADKDAKSDFQFICGTNRDLRQSVTKGDFRADLLARINLWSFRLPGLRERPEDIAPNVRYELEKLAREFGQQVRFNKEAEEAFLRFATSHEARWSGNFRDLNAALVRMATLSRGRRINMEVFEQERSRLLEDWRGDADNQSTQASVDLLEKVLGKKHLSHIDRFDQVQLSVVVETCRKSKNLSEAGRYLFDISGEKRRTRNDADRLRKYLARFGLTWEKCLGENAV
ncbi:MAG: RNA repair transcriptional activator RtcR [Puniceicoccales bacterium]|jgi:transcriptional regulatory protein RtcR|nr:RNA repair transcriptional activator RtcR [Puniceicoccales bacterium]